MTPPKEPSNHLLMTPILLSLGAIRSTVGGEYMHWDKIRHLEAKTPKGLTAEQWWFGIKMVRKALYRQLPFRDKNGRHFVLAMLDVVSQKLHSIDRSSGVALHGTSPIINSQMRDTYLVQSLIEEAITSSQLEGASTSRKVAKEMLQTKRKPKNLSEQMIFNNYKAMQFIRDFKDEDLSIEIILELHNILTKKTLDNLNEAGHLRTTDDIHVWDNEDQVLHTPPKASELKERLKKICQFANAKEDQDDLFIHPIVRAILLHFMLAYDYPFIDGNGRTARILFYWSMAHQGYWLMEFISISEIIKKSPHKYALAYLFTETDENDVTYFIIHQLDVIIQAIDTLHAYIKKQSEEINEIEKLLYTNKTLKNKLNYRQIALIKHALKHPNTHYLIESHRRSHNVTYDTGRTDLLNLAKLNLLIKKKSGKAFIFIVPRDLRKKLEKMK